MDRRTFIIAGSAGFAAVATASWVYMGSTSDTWPTALGLILEPDNIVEIGKKYRMAFPEEDDSVKLTSLLEPVKRADVESKVKEDFIAGRTVQVDGWIISITEARQCALASLAA